MNRQEILDNFVKETNGKGQSIASHGSCLYFGEDHPGCAIGCQPGFRKRFIRYKKKFDFDGMAIEDILLRYRSVKEFFGVKSSDDGDFLIALQCLHDDESNWLSKTKIRATSLGAFCKAHGLTSPLSRGKSS